MSQKTIRAQSPVQAENSPLSEAYDRVRAMSETLCAPLHAEDCVIQSMTEASPTRWHLAHTTWFFETLVLKPTVEGYRPFHSDFEYLFNSYYNTVGDQFPRPKRGLLSRPTMKEVWAYRAYVDEHMRDLFDHLDPAGGDDKDAEIADLIEVGLHHESQHQELILTDIKHVFAQNPLLPTYRARAALGEQDELSTPQQWHRFEEGLRWIGHSGDAFCYDNERPRHREFVEAFELADRLVTNEEYLRFMTDGGYDRPERWLSDGWAVVCQRRWTAPLYWILRDGDWWEFTLSGLKRLRPNEPVCHVSFFEADAYARWAGAELPTEAAWEWAASQTGSLPDHGFVEGGRLHPQPADQGHRNKAPQQMFGQLWQWTRSPYVGYPGYRPPPGAVGEYNGKFMCNQIVLRGGSCATSRAHIRVTYRNFFPPDARWQFSGIRLCRPA